MEMELSAEEYGTRAKGTERLVYRILQTPAYRTVEIISRFLGKILMGPETPESLNIRAQYVIDRISKYGDAAIPRDEWDLVLSSDLAVADGAISRPGKRKSRPRHFKPCKQCGTRFLARRSNQEFHTKKCAARWNRAHPPMDSADANSQDGARNCQTPSVTRINIGV
jgi:hypothetical protein